jgi:(2Fe-2S) ferredoxin
MKYEKHIFICTNQRVDKPRPSCGEAHGLELVKEFKKQLKERGLNISMRAQKTGCMDICEYGPNIVVYPEGVFYGKVQLSDVEEIVTEHLINNRIVERLRIDFSKPPAEVK